MAKIGDYWDEGTVGKFFELLTKYQDLFPTKFSELKGITGELGIMHITLKPEARPIKQRPYWLNPKDKQKVKEELDKMLTTGIIESVEQSDWISPMAIHEKKTKGEICICVDLWKLNDACVNDSFPTPLSDEILDSVGGQEAYSFTDGFSRYHQIRIAPEDCSKTTFSTEWGSFQYKVIPFGLKNTPAIFSRVVVAVFKEFTHNFLEDYFDDWMVFGLVKDHISNLRLMLDAGRKHQISLNVKKCIFCVPFGILLGHIVCWQGLMVDPMKIVVIINLAAPTTEK